MRTWLKITVVTTLAILLVSGARAEDDAQNGSGYLPLYPPSDTYQVQVIGDGIAEGMQVGLLEAFRGDTRVQIKPKIMELNTLMRSAFSEQLKLIGDGVIKEQVTVAVVMLGPQDRVGFRPPGVKKQLWIDSDEWKAEFGNQIDAVMKSLKRQKIAVYWVSLPNVRRSEPNEDVQTLNEIIREKVYQNGVKYIDAYAGFADEGGGYSAMGPDITGKIRLLREQNGVAFTEAGNRKLAHFVEREMKRDLTQAKSDRTIPLAGNEAEQAAINASKNAAAKIAKTVQPGAPGSPAPTPGGTPAQAAADVSTATLGNGDQKPDSGRINLAITTVGGREEIVAVDLLRPAIPASVVALVNSKENANKLTQMGDLLIDQIPGGLMVMSSITPANDSSSEARRRLSPTQTPYFRVMVKGERITPRPDRADDVAWPRPQPPVEASVTPAATAPTEKKPLGKGK